MKLCLKKIRQMRGLTQKEIAALLFISQSVYSRYENGGLEIPLEMLAKLAVSYRVSVDYLLGLTEYPRPYPIFNRLRVTYPPRKKTLF